MKYRITDDALGFNDSLQITAPVFTMFVAILLSVTDTNYAWQCSSQLPTVSNLKVNQEFKKIRKETAKQIKTKNITWTLIQQLKKQDGNVKLNPVFHFKTCRAQQICFMLYRVNSKRKYVSKMGWSCHENRQNTNSSSPLLLIHQIAITQHVTRPTFGCLKLRKHNLKRKTWL